MAGKSSWTTILAPGGHKPPRIHGKDFSKEVAALVLSEFEIYKSYMIWGGLDESVTHLEENIGQKLDAGQHHVLASFCFVRRRVFSERWL